MNNYGIYTLFETLSNINLLIQFFSRQIRFRGDNLPVSRVMPGFYSTFLLNVNIYSMLAANMVIAPCMDIQSRPHDTALSYPNTFLSCANLASTRGRNLAFARKTPVS